MPANDIGRLGTIIAERRLHIRGAPLRTVVVSLGKPRKIRGSSDWQCPFRIEGAGIHQHERGCGIDAFQALTMALEGIRYFLDRSPESLVWGGVIENHSGFQRIIPLVPDLGETRRLERMVDQELRRRLKRLEQRHAKKRRTAAARRAGKGGRLLSSRSLR
jgi:hypothetical protein